MEKPKLGPFKTPRTLDLEDRDGNVLRFEGCSVSRAECEYPEGGSLVVERAPGQPEGLAGPSGDAPETVWTCSECRWADQHAQGRSLDEDRESNEGTARP